MLTMLHMCLVCLTASTFPHPSIIRQTDPTVAPWARGAVDRLRRADVLRGDPGGSFHGKDTASRFDAMVAFNRQRQGQDITTPRTTGRAVALFTAMTPIGSEREMGLTRIELLKDIDTMHDRVAYAWPLFDNGILHGDPNLYFRGRQPLKRSELAMICARMLLVSKTQANMDAARAHFSDIAGDEWYFGAIILTCGAEVMRGYSDHTFRGSQAVTRNELALTLDRLGAAVGWVKSR